MPIRVVAAAASIIVTTGLAWGQGGDIPTLGVYENECLPGTMCTVVLSSQAGHRHPVLKMEVVDVRREPYRLLCHHEVETRPGTGRTTSGGEEIGGLVAQVAGIDHVVTGVDGGNEILVSGQGYPCSVAGRPVPTVGYYSRQGGD